jgi:hypothetical protein
VEPKVEQFTLRGATPNAAAVRLMVSGRLPDGTTVREHAVFFTRGIRVYQRSVIGVAPTAPAVETFFTGLALQVP